MALLYWIPGVVVLLVGANLVRWWLRSGLTKGQVLVTAFFFVLMVLPIAAFYSFMISINWDLGIGEP